MINRRMSQILHDLETMISKRRRELTREAEEDENPSKANDEDAEQRFNHLWPPIRFIIELGQLCYYRLDEHKASQMAAALTYRTIFAIVPVIILGMLGFRMFGDSNEAYKKLSESVTTLLSYDVKAETPETVEFKANINSFVQPFILEISQTKLQNIGLVGAMLFIWAALSFFVTAEQAANEIFSARRGRSWSKRIARYWSIMTLGPLCCVTAIYIAEKLYLILDGAPVIGPAASIIYRSQAFIGSWLILLLFILFTPNRKVALIPAAFASAFVALIWTLGRWGFSAYVGYFLPYSKLYGTIGLIPLFLLWLYLNWYVVLLGMILTKALEVLTDGKIRT